MHQNREKNKKIREQVQSMRDQIRHLENSIHEYSNFWGSDYDIRTMFDFVSEFINA